MIAYKVVTHERKSCHVLNPKYVKEYTKGEIVKATKGTMLFCFLKIEDATMFADDRAYCEQNRMEVIKVEGIGEGIKIDYFNCNRQVESIARFWDDFKKDRNKTIKYHEWNGDGHTGTILFESVKVLT